MKKLGFILISFLSLVSCLKDIDDDYRHKQVEEIITEGKKWTLQIGQTPAEVYAQIQALSKEKKFSSLYIPKKRSIKVEELKNFQNYYDRIDFVIKTEHKNITFFFKDDKIFDLGESRGDLGIIVRYKYFPKDIEQENAVQVGDTSEKVYQKLLKIYETPKYRDNFVINLNIKTLEKPFDPDMVNYDNWNFQIYYGGGKLSIVDLFFREGKLSQIKHIYSEGIVIE